MKKYTSLYLLFAMYGMTMLTMGDATAQTATQEEAGATNAGKTATSSRKKPPSPELRRLMAAEAKAKAEREAKAREAQLEKQRIAEEAQARVQAAARAEAEAKAKRAAELATRQKLITNATELIKNRRAAEAYNLLHPYQSALAGDPAYDYLLGMAALDNGKANEAIFALERVLAVQPNHLQARAEIARAYLAAGEIAASKQEFETVQTQNPPKEVSATIQKYLDIIEIDRANKETSFRSYIEVMLGDDSNVNSATSSKQIAIPAFGGVVMNMNDAGVSNHDTFGSLGAGFNVRHALTPEWAVVGGVNVNQRNNSTQSAFNTGNADANLGLSRNTGNDNYMAVLQMQSFDLNNKHYRDASGMTGQWQRNLDSGSQVSSYLQYSILTYPEQSNHDADRYVLGGAYATSLGGESATVVYVGAYAGAEEARKRAVPYISNSLYGGRVGGEIKLSEQYTLLASFSLENRIYGGKDPLFLVKREDTQSDLRIGVNYIPAQLWTISPNLAYTYNQSNIKINKYERTLFSINVRRDFN